MLFLRIALAVIFFTGAFGYVDYTLFRWVVFLGLGILLWDSLQSKIHTQLYNALLIAFLIIFNPIIPVYLYDRSFWMLLDVAAASFLLLYLPLLPVFLKDLDVEKSQPDEHAGTGFTEKKLPEWVDYPDQQRRQYLKESLQFDPFVGEHSSKPDYDQIKKDAVAMAGYSYLYETDKQKKKRKSSPRDLPKQNRPKQDMDDKNYDYKIKPSVMSESIQRTIKEYNFSNEQIHEVPVKEWLPIYKEFMKKFSNTPEKVKLPIDWLDLKDCYEITETNVDDVFAFHVGDTPVYLLFQESTGTPNFFIYKGKMEAIKKVMDNYRIFGSQCYVFPENYQWLVGENRVNIELVFGYGAEFYVKRFAITPDQQTLKKLGRNDAKLIKNKEDLTELPMDNDREDKRSDSIDMNDDDLPF